MWKKFQESWRDIYFPKGKLFLTGVKSEDKCVANSMACNGIAQILGDT